MGKRERRVAEARERRQVAEAEAAGSTPTLSVATPRSLAKLIFLGALSALWSVVLWEELVLVRSGGSSFCGFGGRFDCAAVWNGAFASAVHKMTGLPIAGWGLAWSAVAFLLPLIALLRRAEGKSIDPLVSATRMTAVAGVLSVAVMIAESAIAGTICVGCIATYILVGAYTFIALLQWRPVGFPSVRRGAVLAAVGAVAAFLLLLYPGLKTPKTSGEAGRRAVEEVARREAGSVPVGTGDPRRDQKLTELVTSLEPPLKQTLADSLAIYRASRSIPPPAPRALVGSDLAPVKITEFTDILCEHCATLHETLKTLRESLPPGSFSVDSRQFPLDSRCNPLVGGSREDDVRCVAAKARICLEPTGNEPKLADALFASQKGLTREKVFEIATPFITRTLLESCLDAPATRAKLEEDISAASHYDSDGTPIVVVNGRKGTSFGPFLYAIIQTRGSGEHPSFAVLPSGDPGAHLH
ncbi:MAG TPA: thioredoxin domain-containing protein [Thermoanaerobaculia bacterium]|nr:thioredoxin domain-containing protein [Thermoanaerobaculia bacterium]